MDLVGVFQPTPGGSDFWLRGGVWPKTPPLPKTPGGEFSDPATPPPGGGEFGISGGDQGGSSPPQILMTPIPGGGESF